MTAHQTAVINGLLAENFGKNDLIRTAEAQSRAAQSRANDAEHEANSLRNEVGSLAAKVRYLERQLERAKVDAAAAQTDTQKYKQEAEAFRGLLSKPMKEIADMSGDFKKTYEIQQQMLAEWIMGQKAYRETAMQLGAALDMTPEQVQKVAAPNFAAVLENRTKFGNNANDGTPTLAERAESIIAIRKKNGKM